jgi:flagellar hook-associated protein FlgK
VTDSKQVQATDYKLQFNGTDWTVTRLSDKTSFTMSPDASGNLSFDGLNVNVSGTANQRQLYREAGFRRHHEHGSGDQRRVQTGDGVSAERRRK